MEYCPSPYSYQRRKSRVVRVGEVAIGGENPVRVQSMITCDTMDTAASIQQTLDLVAVGCEIVRITAPTVKDAANLQHIVAGLRERGCNVPIVADIHFKPEAAMEAAKWVEKVRINPGNYADSKKFKVLEYTDEQYAAELERIRERFSPLVKFCKEHGRAMRIGTNHGSLSDRIMNRYGDTPLGMVESALEFARIARELDYHEFVFSMKSSNPKVMIEAYRLLVARLGEEDLRFKNSDLRFGKNAAAPEGNENATREAPDSKILNPKSEILNSSWAYPIHLGVTEAGDGEDARIKSAIGIGSLLLDGIGDTIRVSLTEDSIHEIPVAKKLIAATSGIMPNAPKNPPVPKHDPFSYRRRATGTVTVAGTQIGGEQVMKVLTPPDIYGALAHKIAQLGEYKPDGVLDQPRFGTGIVDVDPEDDEAIAAINRSPEPQLVTVRPLARLIHPTVAFRTLAAKLDERHPILLTDDLCPRDERGPQPDFLDYLLETSATLGSLICDGIGDAILLTGWDGPGQLMRVSFNLLQAAGARIFKTDYVACPSCGRTLFNLQETTALIKATTSHLKGVKIAIMGCIVNGPGEMADADFGYVGGAPAKINLYVGKKPVKFNIPQAEAVARLVDLIKEHGKWIESA